MIANISTSIFNKICRRIIIPSIIYFILSGLMTNSIQAQHLEELLQMVERDNIELKILQNEYDAAVQRAPQVSELPDPEVGIGAFPFPVETRVGAQVARISASQMFPWPGLLDTREELELAKAKAIYEKIAARKLDIDFQLKLAYYQLYRLDQSQVIIRRNITLLKALEELALAKVESGRATAADVLRVQLKTEELSQEIDILEASKQGPIARINQLLHRPENTPIVVEDRFDFAQLPYQRDELARLIKEQHPLIKMFALQQDVSRKAIDLNNLNAKPSFGVGLDYITVRKRADVEINKNGGDIVQLRASIKVPLFRKKYAAKTNEENLKILALENKKEDVLTKYLSSIDAAYADYQAEALRIHLYDRQIDLTHSAIRILQADYSSKGRNFDELLRLERELVDYDLKKLKSIVNSHVAKSTIERFLLSI